MTTEVLIFGQLTDITATSRLEVQDVQDTSGLLEALQQRFPALATARFVVAVNQQMVRENTAIPPGAQVALLPPFSGG